MKKLTSILFLCGILFYSFLAMLRMVPAMETTLTVQFKSLSSDAAKGYVGPIVSSFGSNLNTGWVTKVPSPSKLSFSLELKVIAMGTVIDDAQKTFSTVGSFNFTDSQAGDIASQVATK